MDYPQTLEQVDNLYIEHHRLLRKLQGLSEQISAFADLDESVEIARLVAQVRMLEEANREMEAKLEIYRKEGLDYLV